MSAAPGAGIAVLLGEAESRFARRGHFVYEGGAHGDTRLALDLLFASPRRARAAAIELARLGGKTVILVDDVINSGVATRACIREIEAAGGRTVAVGSMIARDAARLRRDLGLPVDVLAELPWQTWPASGCPLCRAGAPID